MAGRKALAALAKGPKPTKRRYPQRFVESKPVDCERPDTLATDLCPRQIGCAVGVPGIDWNSNWQAPQVSD